MPRALRELSVETPVPPQKRPPEELTCIHAGIHYTATPDTGDLNSYDELDRIDIDNLISTLAEVAISIARREQQCGDHESSSLHKGL